MKLNDVIQTTDSCQTNILITKPFNEETCDWCEQPLELIGLCGRYALSDGENEKPALVTLCFTCLEGIDI